ncbi:hypothetical protein N7492_000680 [Penicillium capsulatum]|uniref:Uncharacterized protein n=1 Tax=Penicillium capsulatum TaxID=69766 RepID=A0A9W9IS78_9EURO|nr:hypothetical protein N7492_000680 [Penicillium capsulatum]
MEPLSVEAPSPTHGVRRYSPEYQAQPKTYCLTAAHGCKRTSPQARANIGGEHVCNNVNQGREDKKKPRGQP